MVYWAFTSEWFVFSFWERLHWLMRWGGRFSNRIREDMCNVPCTWSYHRYSLIVCVFFCVCDKKTQLVILVTTKTEKYRNTKRHHIETRNLLRFPWKYFEIFTSSWRPIFWCFGNSIKPFCANLYLWSRPEMIIIKMNGRFPQSSVSTSTLSQST